MQREELVKTRRIIFVSIQLALGVSILSVAILLLLDHFKIIETVKPFVVMSGSMNPAVKLGSVVVVKPESSYRPGDIITYAPDGNKENPITHRIVFRKFPEGPTGEPVFITAGDANDDFDSVQVGPANVIGRVQFSIPYLGYLVSLAKQPYGFILFVIVPATIVIYEELKILLGELRKSGSKMLSWVRFKRKTKDQSPRTSLSINLLGGKENNFPKAGAFIPVIGTILVLAAFTSAFYSDEEKSSGNIFGAAESFGEECPVCEKDQAGAPVTVVVDQNVTIDFNQANPANYYSGDPDLQPYFSYNTSGATAGEWKAIFDLGGKKLVVKNGATITTTKVPNTGTNRFAPGIEILSTCEFELEDGGHIIVESQNRQAGDIFIKIDGNITINGEIRNEVTGSNGLPGKITISSCCGNIVTGTSSRILDIGIDPGGNDINITDCCGGDITLNGLVMSRAHAHSGDLTLNRPRIRVVSFKGAVTINGNSTEPLLDEYSFGGGLYDLWGGLLSWVTTNSNPGSVEVQAEKVITVNGHGVDPTVPQRTSFGAIASIATASDAPGGVVDVRSIGGKIIGNDRAFDVSGRNRLATNFAHISLFAKDNIELSRLGANDDFNPVVDATAPGAGDKGGTNELRSYSGSIIINTNARVSANVVSGSGTDGTNLLTSCGGVTNNGSVTPADANGADDSGVCSPDSPEKIFASCLDFGVGCSCNPSSATAPVVINEVYYDVASDKGSEGDTANPDEWVELYNNTGSPVNLKNWTITDNSDTRTISNSNKYIPANGFALLSKSAATWTFWTVPAAAEKIELGQKVGNGLANTGDVLVLKNNVGITVDAMNYGTDTSIWNPAATDVAEGHSLERDPDGDDTDLPADFIDRTTPTPGT